MAVKKLTTFESLWSLWILIRENWQIIAVAVFGQGGIMFGFWKYIQFTADLEGWWVYPFSARY
jgi:hypothetical protein